VWQKKRYDLCVHKKVFAPGEWVWYFHPRRRVGLSPKWQKWYTGPFLIVKQLGPVNYQLQRSKRSVPFTAHVDKLKACLHNCPQSWLPEGAGHEPSEQPDPVEQVQMRPEIQIVSGTGNKTLPREGPEPGPLASSRPRRVIRPPIQFRSVYTNDCTSVYMVTGME